MLHHKKWIIALICFLTLLNAFSMSTGFAYAASNISHGQLNSSSQLRPLPEGPPGCENLVKLDDTTTNPIDYHGHVFTLEEQLFGWYATLNDGTNVFCNQIVCWSWITPSNRTPPGDLGVICGPQSKTITKWIAGSNVGDIIYTDVAHSGTRGIASCATFLPAGGSIYKKGWGCGPGTLGYSIPISF